MINNLWYHYQHSKQFDQHLLDAFSKDTIHLETIDIFIDDYVNTHILDYKEKDFENSVKEGVYSQILEIYLAQAIL